jgi:hypothetical protein
MIPLRILPTTLTLAASLLLSGCLEDVNPSSSAPAEANTFTLKPEVDLSTLEYTKKIDLNLGHTPENFVRAIWKQLTGEEPESEQWLSAHIERLGTEEFPRRIDLALLLAEEAGEGEPTWIYSDPWIEQIPLVGSPKKALERDIGAVMMFFFSSPNRPNGGAGWANNHAPGMYFKDPIMELEEQESTPHDGYYHPENAAFWYMELRDARYAGLDFVLPNVYGPDLDAAHMEPMQIALEKLRKEDGNDVIKLGMFDDTWTWGQPYFGPFWEQLPDCNDVEATAKLLFEAKWKPYFTALPREHWYLVEGKPMIYFYNNNTLQNKDNFDQVLPVMKQLFKEEFGVEPWVAVDTAYNYKPNMKVTSDSHFKWYTLDLPEKFASETRTGITLSHAMPRWDSTSRWNDQVEARAKEGDLLVKDASVLKEILDGTTESDILVLATWNDLGEGTGINRCYDYYLNGEWKQPDYFMQLIRRSQMGEKLLD